MKNRGGFSLIELLVVITILVLLAGMLMPVVSMARTRAAKTNTMALMYKVETGLELFKGEVDVYPYQKHSTETPFPESENRLAWILAHQLEPDERTALNEDLSAVRSAYGPDGLHRVAAEHIDPAISNNFKEAHTMMVSRSATERAGLAVIAGNAGVMGILPNQDSPIIGAPVSSGYAFDFLSSDLRKGDVDGDAIVDFYGRPLIYNCPVEQGVMGFELNTTHINNGWGSGAVNPEYYGLHTKGRTATDSMVSDQRSTAAPAYVDSFELWSAGPDGLIEGRRDRSVNKDNISVTDYWKSLK